MILISFSFVIILFNMFSSCIGVLIDSTDYASISGGLDIRIVVTDRCNFDWLFPLSLRDFEFQHFHKSDTPPDQLNHALTLKMCLNQET